VQPGFFVGLRVNQRAALESLRVEASWTPLSAVQLENPRRADQNCSPHSPAGIQSMDEASTQSSECPDTSGDTDTTSLSGAAAPWSVPRGVGLDDYLLSVNNSSAIKPARGIVMHAEAQLLSRDADRRFALQSVSSLAPGTEVLCLDHQTHELCWDIIEEVSFATKTSWSDIRLRMSPGAPGGELVMLVPSQMRVLTCGEAAGKPVWLPADKVSADSTRLHVLSPGLDVGAFSLRFEQWEVASNYRQYSARGQPLEVVEIRLRDGRKHAVMSAVTAASASNTISFHGAGASTADPAGTTAGMGATLVFTPLASSELLCLDDDTSLNDRSNTSDTPGTPRTSVREDFRRMHMPPVIGSL